MPDTLPRRLIVIAVATLMLLAAAFTAQAQTGTTDDDVTDEATDEPTDEATDEPTDGPTDQSTDRPTDEPTDEPTASAGDNPFDAALRQLVTTEEIDADSLYDAFLTYLISEYDTTVVVDDDVLSIQIDLEDLER